MNKKNFHILHLGLQNDRLGSGLALITLLSVIGIYNLLFFNKYFPITEGWFSVYAKAILRGAIPYRDFHLALPPLYPLKIAGLMYFFGPDFIVLRVFGIFLILLMSSILFILLSRVFAPHVACFASIIAILYYQSGVAHITYDFLHFLTAYTLFSTYLICRHAESEDHSLKTVKGLRTNCFLLIAGIFGSLAFFTKQSNGAILIMFSLFAIGACSYTTIHGRTLTSLCAYLAGVAIPASLALMWLSTEAALEHFFQQVFFQAAESKGTIWPILFGWFPRLITKENAIVLIGAAIIALLIGYNKLVLSKQSETHERLGTNPKLCIFTLIFVFSFLSIMLPFISTRFSERILHILFFHRAYHGLIIISTIASVIWFSIYLSKLIIGKGERNRDVFIISTVSLGFLYGTATSAGISEAGAFLGFGLLLAHFLSARPLLSARTLLCFFAGLIFITYLVSQKYTQPYFWWGLTQPDIRTAKEPASVGVLRGFRLSTETARVISSVEMLIKTHSDIKDSVFAFPNIPLFYYLTGRLPNTFAMVHWFDVVTDGIAIAEARHILESPPKIIVYLRLPEATWSAHEQIFRGGARSGQRVIAEAIETLIDGQNLYTLLGEFMIPNDYKLEVWFSNQRLHKSIEKRQF